MPKTALTRAGLLALCCALAACSKAKPGISKGSAGSTSGGATTGSTGSAGTSSASGSTASASSGASSGSLSSGSAGSGSGSAGSGSGSVSSSTGTSSTSGSASSTGSSGSSGSTGALVCPPGHYDFDSNPADGCEVTCDATHCAWPDGGTIPLDALPPYQLGDDGGAFGRLSPGSQLSQPMTAQGFTNFGHFKSLGDEPDAGPSMRSSGFTNQTDFLGVVR